jgi:hypothetical protein
VERGRHGPGAERQYGTADTSEEVTVVVCAA